MFFCVGNLFRIIFFKSVLLCYRENIHKCLWILNANTCSQDGGLFMNLEFITVELAIFKNRYIVVILCVTWLKPLCSMHLAITLSNQFCWLERWIASSQMQVWGPYFSFTYIYRFFFKSSNETSVIIYSKNITWSFFRIQLIIIPAGLKTWSFVICIAYIDE